MRKKTKTIMVLLMLSLAIITNPIGLGQGPNYTSSTPIFTVDVAGDGAHIAIGFGSWVAYFETISSNMLWMDYTGYNVSAVVLSEDGQYLAVASNEEPYTDISCGYVSLYDATNGVLIFRHRVDHTIAGITRAIDITRDGQYVAVGTRAEVNPTLGSIYLFRNPDFGTHWVKHYDANSWVHCVRFSGDGLHFAAGCYLNSMHFFDIPPDCTVPLLPLWTVSDCPDAYYSIGISYNAEYIATGHTLMYNVRLYDGFGNLVWVSPQQGMQSRITMSDDAQYFAISQTEFFPTDINGFHYFSTFNPVPIWSFPTTDQSYYVDMSVFNAMYVVGANRTEVYQWGDGRPPPPSPIPMHIFPVYGNVTDVSISYSGTIYAASDDAGFLYVFLAGIAGDNLLWEWQTPMPPELEPPTPPIGVKVRSVDVAGDGAHIAIGFESWVAYFETISGNLLWTDYTGHNVSAVVLSEDGQYLAVASVEEPNTEISYGYVSLYDATDGSLIFRHRVDHCIEGLRRAIDITRDGQYIVVGTGGSGSIGSIYLFRNPDFGDYWVRYYNANSWVHSVRFSGDGQHFVAGCYYWDMHFFDIPTDCTQPFTPVWTAYSTDPFYSVAISYYAERIATGQGNLHRVSLYDGSGNRLWFSPQQGMQCRITMSDDAQYFAVAQKDCHPTDFNGFHYFNTTSSTPMWSFQTTDSSYYVDMSVFNAMYVVGANRTTVYQWGDGHPAPPSNVPEHEFLANGNITDVSMSYSGTIYAASDNNLLWSWNN
jgi:photosystem II stability/assembly factor-like uncharacterized protein